MITMRDIARECSVSIQTVSRILRGHGDAYREETVASVLATAERLQYRPPWAQVAQGDRQPTLAMITTGFRGEVHGQRLAAINAAAQKAGYQFSVTAEAQVRDSMQLLRTASSLVAQGVAGLFILRSVPIDAETRRALEQLVVPVVFIDWGPPRWQARVVFDRKPAIEQIARHLAELGHQRVGFTARRWTADFLEHKILPFRRALSRHGIHLAVHSEWLIPNEGHLGEAAHQVTQSLIAEPDGITALIASNDEIALAMLAAMREIGLSVPGDLSVVGFDDLPMASLGQPALTTVRTPGAAVGPAAVQMMLERIRQPRAEIRQITLPSELIVRQSTGPARSEIAISAARDPHAT